MRSHTRGYLGHTPHCSSSSSTTTHRAAQMLIPQIPLLLPTHLMLMLVKPLAMLVLLVLLIINSSRPNPFPNTMQLPTDFLRGSPNIRITLHYSLDLVPDFLSPGWGMNVSQQNIPEMVFWEVRFWVKDPIDVVVMCLVRQFDQHVLD